MKQLRNLFIPYSKVHPKYNHFAKWSMVSTCISSIESVCSTHCLLNCVSDQPSPFAVSYTYLTKDVIGQFGGLYVIHKYSQHIDKNITKFSVINNILFQSCIILECATPMIIPEAFIPITVLSSIGRNISMVFFGAMNARCIQHLAIDKNIGELYSHIGILNTFASSIGMTIGLGVIWLIPDHEIRLFCVIPFLFLGRMWAYRNMIKILS
jgi:hypothetical protein